MKDNRLCYGTDGLDGMDIPENNPFESDMCIFGGMTQEEIEAKADCEDAEESKGW
jgi:hypothetical protein